MTTQHKLRRILTSDFGRGSCSIMEVNLEQPKKKKQRLNDAPVAVYRIIEVPPDIEGVAKTATIQIVPKVDEDEEISNQSVAGDKVNVTVTTSFVIGEDSSVKQHSTSQVIRLPVSLRGRRRKIADGSDTDGSFSSLTRHILTHVRRGNKMAIEDLAETNSKIAITEDHAIADSVEKDDLNESESSYEKSKKSVILKVTRTKMKDLSKIKHLQELKKALTAKSLPCETEDDAKKLEIPPGMPECDPDDPTILPPQDETISKETTTEDAFSILTAAEDFGSTKDIPVPLLPPPLPISFDATCSTEENLLFAPSSGESEYILSGEEPGELTNDSSDANKEEPDKIITIISLARDEGTSNEQNSAAGSSNANVFVTMVNDGTDNNIEDSIVVGGDNNSIVETIVPDSLNSSEQDGSTSKSCNLDTIYSEVPAKLNPEEILLLKKAAKMVLSSKSEF
ncbi:hypothetical protein C0J52_01408 [Blattella germanica]|nr:hypothetical protein C0J52_01408 [Blattella germanica]